MRLTASRRSSYRRLSSVTSTFLGFFRMPLTSWGTGGREEMRAFWAAILASTSSFHRSFLPAAATAVAGGDLGRTPVHGAGAAQSAAALALLLLVVDVDELGVVARVVAARVLAGGVRGVSALAGGRRLVAAGTLDDEHRSDGGCPSLRRRDRGSTVA